jgi:hypothetical protein
MQKERQAKRAARQKQTAEVFTPSNLVNEMLDKLPPEAWEENETFCDPAAGNGNFLVEVLKRKLLRGHDPLAALQTIYGVDLMPDNIEECRLRLLKLANHFLKNQGLTPQHIEAVWTNIVCADSLAYDFEFDKPPSPEQCKAILENIKKENLFDKVDVFRSDPTEHPPIKEVPIKKETPAKTYVPVANPPANFPIIWKKAGVR